VFGLGPATRIYLAAGVTDMRKGFEGLYGMVRDRLSCEPLSGHLFVFCNAQRNRLKVLVWDGSGLARIVASSPTCCAGYNYAHTWPSPLERNSGRMEIQSLLGAGGMG
jgi:transposase